MSMAISFSPWPISCATPAPSWVSTIRWWSAHPLSPTVWSRRVSVDYSVDRLFTAYRVGCRRDLVLGARDLPFVVLAAVAAALIAAVPFAALGAKQDDGRSRWWSALLAGAVVGSGVAYVLATLSPLSVLGEIPRTVDGALTLNLNLVPVIDMLSTPLRLLLINLALLAPLGFFLRLRWPRVGILGVTLISLVLAVGVEAAQLFHPMRGSNVDDVLLNVLGAVAGGLIASTVDFRHRQPVMSDHPG